jgi:histidinol-phosphate aminotransferase
MKNHTHDVAAMADTVDGRTRLVYIANPNNPTGTYVRQADLDSFLERVPGDAVVVVDEAYHEYITEPDFPRNTLAWIARKPRLIVLRTFSKAHGLAGLRIGYGVSSAEIVDAMNRLRSPFNANSVAQAAAIAALDDFSHVNQSRENNLAGREYLYREFQRLGVEYVPTVANFILVLCPRDAEDIYRELLPKGLIVRPMGSWGYPKGIRVSIGKPSENETFVRDFEALLRRS